MLMRMQMSSMGLVQSDGNMCDVSLSTCHYFCVQSRVTPPSLLRLGLLWAIHWEQK